MAITGERPPMEPPTGRDYAARGLPWFDYHGEDARALAGSEKLRELRSVVQQAEATGRGSFPDNVTIAAPHAIAPGKRGGCGKVRRLGMKLKDTAAGARHRWTDSRP